MNTNKRVIVFALLLIVSITNYIRITSNGALRTVEFLSIFAIGAISGLLLQEIIIKIKNK